MLLELELFVDELLDEPDEDPEDDPFEDCGPPDGILPLGGVPIEPDELPPCIIVELPFGPVDEEDFPTCIPPKKPSPPANNTSAITDNIIAGFIDEREDVARIVDWSCCWGGGATKPSSIFVDILILLVLPLLLAIQ